MGDRLQIHRGLKTKEAFDKKASKNSLAKLTKGQEVLIQDPTSGKWSRRGKIVRARSSGKLYEVASDGWTTVRSRKHLRPANS